MCIHEKWSGCKAIDKKDNLGGGGGGGGGGPCDETVSGLYIASRWFNRLEPPLMEILSLALVFLN